MTTTRIINNQGVRLQAFAYGDPANPPVVLVHGYPDNHHVWEPVATQLSAQYFVITYDVRGAGGSDVPAHVADYRLALLVSDLQAVVDVFLGERAFHLVGHDWGAIQSWEAVTHGALQARILSFTCLSGPCLDHVGCWLQERATSLSWRDKAPLIRQLASSWYIGLFHLPALGAWAWRLGLDKLWPYFLKHQENVSEPARNPTQRKDGQYGVRLYRANVLPRLLKPVARYAACPVQLIVPLDDHYVGAQMFEDLPRWTTVLQRREIQAGHWVLLSHPEQIAAWVADFAATTRRTS